MEITSEMSTTDSIGLFLGAGASYELGMPLVWDLTGEFKGYFTPEDLRELNAGWAKQGGGYDSTVIESTIQLIQRDDLHYENILGYLQTVARRPNQPFAVELRLATNLGPPSEVNFGPLGEV